jgi:hypothetical protein
MTTQARSAKTQEGNQNTGSMSGILKQLEKASNGQDNVSIGDVVEAFGHRSHAPFLIVPALIELTPIGGIPGVPTFLTLIIFIFAIQMAIGRPHLWLPDFLEKRSVSSERLEKSVDKLKPWGEKLDRWLHGGPDFFTGKFAIRIAAAICVLLTLTVPPLEVIPFASSAPMLTIAVFGFAMLFHNGYLMIAGYVVGVLAFWIVWWMV